jgi:Cu/Ag efflux protein CusF
MVQDLGQEGRLTARSFRAVLRRRQFPGHAVSERRGAFWSSAIRCRRNRFGLALAGLLVSVVFADETKAFGVDARVCSVPLASIPWFRVQETAAVGTFRGVGVIRAVNPAAGAVTLNHEEIKGFMAAMVMMYRVQPLSLTSGLEPGDKVEFAIDAQTYTISDIKLIEPKH